MLPGSRLDRCPATNWDGRGNKPSPPIAVQPPFINDQSDLAIAAAIASSSRDIAVRADAVLIGEIGLAGELRMPGQMQARLREAAKLGFKCAIVPKAIHKGEAWPKDIEIVEARSLSQALDAAFAIQRKSPRSS